ncbi:Oligosaccaryltransferase-domain-containing protein [Aspergillus pseudodeflectus]|uniref:Dolichyl-diphosphooligosaccharide--protein glycosyltransferase subunit 4 n=1 Tax=Aspergillus pseudodeflectus TaxID=176178 RepID=A0ABR4KS20_9EURO
MEGVSGSGERLDELPAVESLICAHNLADKAVSIQQASSPTLTPSRIPSINLDLTARRKSRTMITDNDLHRLAVFLGSCAMILIVLYHFLEVNAKDDEDDTVPATKNSKNGSTDAASRTTSTAAAGGSSVSGGGKDR